MSWACGWASVKLTRPARWSGAGPRMWRPSISTESFVGVAGQLVFVAGDFFEADQR